MSDRTGSASVCDTNVVADGASIDAERSESSFVGVAASVEWIRRVSCGDGCVWEEERGRSKLMGADWPERRASRAGRAEIGSVEGGQWRLGQRKWDVVE